jgi:hypothetical protein
VHVVVAVRRQVGQQARRRHAEDGAREGPVGLGVRCEEWSAQRHARGRFRTHCCRSSGCRRRGCPRRRAATCCGSCPRTPSTPSPLPSA